jgi:DNA polymerase III alpha subunit (gram-positive type)
MYKMSSTKEKVLEETGVTTHNDQNMTDKVSAGIDHDDRFFIYFDLESTGLSRWHDKITQIGATACLRKQGNYSTVSTFETLVKCDRKIHEKAAEKTGIYEHTLVNAPCAREGLNKFFDWLKTLHKDYPDYAMCIVAYNGVNFDFPLLLSELHRWDFSPHLLFSACNVDYLLDPLIWARANIDTTCLLRKGTGNCSFVLSDVHTALTGEPISNAHQALADTEGLMNICVHEKFKDMHVREPSAYALEVSAFLDDFMKKRQSIDVAIRKNTKKKIRSIFDMQSKKRKRTTDDEIVA